MRKPPCNCYYGGDCTRSSLCAVQAVEDERDALVAELAGVRADLAMCEAKCSSQVMRDRVTALEAALREAMELLHQTTFDSGAISAAEWERRYRTALGKLTDSFKYSTEVVQIAREALEDTK